MSGAFVLAINDDGLLLAVSRGYPPVKFALPGGCIEPDELAVDAAARELYEETGLTAPELHQLTDERGAGRGVVTYWAPTVRGRLRSSDEGLAVWVEPELIVDGPFGGCAARAIAALADQLYEQG